MESEECRRREREREREGGEREGKRGLSKKVT